MVKEIRKEMGVPLAILLDTSGPEIRVGCFAKGGAELKEGEQFTLTGEDIVGDEKSVSISYRALAKDIKAGDKILIDDGLIELKAVKTEDRDIICRVENGGLLTNRKSVNVPGIRLNLPYLNQKDEDDILFGIQEGVDFIAASFTRSAADILDIKNLLEKHNASDIKIIAKIENKDGIDHIDDILKVCDGIMVARGDLGVEIDFIELPRYQKYLIKKCLKIGKTVIIATQMLDSMIHNPRPTRAETSDVANAVYEGVSAIMLSGETAAGKYPLESLKTMVSIAVETEKDIDYGNALNNVNKEKMSLNRAIAHATCTTAHDLKAAAIVSFTVSGNTARLVSSFRPSVPVIACAPYEKIYHQLSLTWGVYPVIGDAKKDSDFLFDNAVEKALSSRIINHGDLVVITAGLPLGVSGTTNTIQVYIAGDVLITAKGLNQLSVSGPVYVAKDQEKMSAEFMGGHILVIPGFDQKYLPLYHKAKAIIIEKSISSPAAADLMKRIPMINKAKGAADILKTGQVVTVDASRGVVYSGVTRTNTA